MTVYARLAPEKDWHRNEDGSPGFARILCGKLVGGAHRCGGVVGYLVFGDLLLSFDGMRLDPDGIWRITQAARKHYSKTGVLALPLPIDAEKRERHLARNPAQRQPLPQIELSGLTQSPEVECPRCGKQQAVLDADDLAVLASTALP